MAKKKKKNKSFSKFDNSTLRVDTTKEVISLENLDAVVNNKSSYSCILSVEPATNHNRNKLCGPSILGENERFLYLHGMDANSMDVHNGDHILIFQVITSHDNEKNVLLNNVCERQILENSLGLTQEDVIDAINKPLLVTIVKARIVCTDNKVKRDKHWHSSPPSAKNSRNPVVKYPGEAKVGPLHLFQRQWVSHYTPPATPDENFEISSLRRDVFSSDASEVSNNPSSCKENKKNNPLRESKVSPSKSKFSFSKGGGGDVSKVPVTPSAKLPSDKLIKKIIAVPLHSHQDISKLLLGEATSITLELLTPHLQISLESWTKSTQVLERIVLAVYCNQYVARKDIVNVSFQGRKVQFSVRKVTMRNKQRNIDERLPLSMEELNLNGKDNSTTNVDKSPIIKIVKNNRINDQFESLPVSIPTQSLPILFKIDYETQVNFEFLTEIGKRESSYNAKNIATDYCKTKDALIKETNQGREPDISEKRAATTFVAGLDLVIQQIHSILVPSLLHPELFPRAGPIRAPKGVLLHGPSGTGKSLLAAQIAQNLQQDLCDGNRNDYTNQSTKKKDVRRIVETVTIDCAIIQSLSSIVGNAERKLTGIFKQAERRAQEKNVSTLIVLDDIHHICPTRGYGNVMDNIASTLLALLDGIGEEHEAKLKIPSLGNVAVLAVTNDPSKLDPALRRAGRLDAEVEVPIPDENTRCNILEFVLSEMDASIKILGNLEKSDFVALASRAKGCTGADMVLGVKEAARRAILRYRGKMGIESPSFSVEMTLDDLKNGLGSIKPSVIKSIILEVPHVPWSSIGGMKHVKQLLKESIELPLTHSNLFAALSVPPPRGVLMYGPPGCSKTLMARALATEGKMNFLAVKGPELLSKWLGESERALASLFRRARMASPCVIFFDEIDAIASKRGAGDSSGGGERILSQLLTELDGVSTSGGFSESQNNKVRPRVVVVGATNRPDLLDSALTRPGRIDRMIYVGLPDEESRQSILRIGIRGKAVAKEIDVNALAIKSLTGGFSGAELISICREAALYAIEEFDNLSNVDDLLITMTHFLKAIQTTKRQTTSDMLEFYASIRSKDSKTET